MSVIPCKIFYVQDRDEHSVDSVRNRTDNQKLNYQKKKYFSKIILFFKTSVSSISTEVFFLKPNRLNKVRFPKIITESKQNRLKSEPLVTSIWLFVYSQVLLTHSTRQLSDGKITIVMRNAVKVMVVAVEDLFLYFENNILVLRDVRRCQVLT